ncbi:MAG: ornithine cyclodeaminase family protein [Rubrivivax sp.]
MKILDAEATRRALPFPALIDALREMFVSGCEVPLRHNHTIADAQGAAAGTLLLMPAWRAGERLGIKTVAVFAGNAALGKPALHASYLLLDARTGEPLALIDGDQITARRTVAASALAASFLARADASRLLIVGAGRVAALLAQAHSVLRPIRHIEVWARRAEAAQQLAQSLRQQGLKAQAVTELAAAVRRADIVSCATLATEPLVKGLWLQAGAHLDLIGSFTPQMREADAACFARARLFTDTTEAMSKSGDVLQAIAEGAITADALQGTLGGLCTLAVPGRGGAEQITLFKSVGTALEDLAAAELVYNTVG